MGSPQLSRRLLCMRLPSLTQLVRVILNSILHTVSFQALEQEYLLLKLTAFLPILMTLVIKCSGLSIS